MFLKILCGLIMLALFTACAQTTKSEGHAERIPLKDKQAYIRYAYYMLDSYLGVESDFQSEIPPIKDYEKFFITLMHRNQTRGCQSGSASKSDPQRTRLDIEEAIKRCIEDRRFGGKFTQEELSEAVLVFNVFFNRRQVRGDLKQLATQIEPGIHAIEIKQGQKRAFFKECVPIVKNYDLQQTLEKLCTKAKLEKEACLNPETEIYIYDTVTFKGDREGKIVVLYRYNILLDLDAMDNELVYERLKLARSWFLNNVSDTQMLEYEYYPSEDRYSTENNHVRQVAAIWIAAELSNFLDDPDLHNFVGKALDHYLTYKVCADDYCYLRLEKGKLAYNAFLVLALIATPEYPERDDLLHSLGRGILTLQNEDGSYNTYFRSSRISGVDFYPGEAMLALMRLYKETGEKAYLESVKKAFPYYRAYWRGNKNTAFIPWHSQAYLLLYQETKDPSLSEFVFEMNDWIIENHQVRTSAFPDEVGAFTRTNPRFSTSSYLEGLNDAYVMAKLVNDRKRIKIYRQSIREATRFLLLTQYTPENSFYLKNPARAIGGFRFSLKINTQRNDYTQHAVAALIKSYHNKVLEEK